MRLLYDLAGEDPACRFSPYCWRVRIALALKGLAVDTVPVRFSDKALIAFSGQDRVPVLRDGDRIVSDSVAIATYLDAAYPDGAPLFGEDAARALTGFVRQWAEWVLHPALLPLIIMDIHARLGPADQAYFRTSREARFGCTLEAIAGDRAAAEGVFKATLKPLAALLAKQPYLAGDTPAFADCVVFGTFQWARVVRAADVLDDGSPIAAWRERMLDIGGGIARNAYTAGAMIG